MDDRAEMLTDAQQRLERGDNEGAVELLTRYVAKAPDDARAHALLGMARAAGHYYRSAVDELRRAAALDPSQPSYQFNLGCALEALGDIVAALAAYQTAVDLTPGYQIAREAIVRVTASAAPNSNPASAQPDPSPATTVIPQLQQTSVAGNAPPRGTSPSRFNTPPDLVQDLGGLRRADEPPDLVRWIGIGYAILAVLFVFGILFTFVAILSATTSSLGRAAIPGLGFGILKSAIGAGICGGLYRGFVNGSRAAWYGQFVVSVLALLCLPLAYFSLLYLLIPAAGAGILFHWRSPVIRSWFGVK